MTAAIWTAPDAWARPGSSRRCDAQILKQGRQKPCLRIVRNLFAALDRSDRCDSRTGPARWSGSRSCWPTGTHAATKLADTETRMTACSTSWS